MAVILLASEIVEEMRSGRIVVDPFDESLLNPNSIDVRLGGTLKEYVHNTFTPMGLDPRVCTASVVLDPRVNNPTMEHEIPEGGLVLEPGKLYLGRTLEYTETHAHVPMLDGKSSMGRLGLSVHVTAGRGDLGFCGCWTLELTCVHPVRVYPGIKIGQIWYLVPVGEQARKYEGRYQGHRDPTACRLYLDEAG